MTEPATYPTQSPQPGTDAHLEEQHLEAVRRFVEQQKAFHIHAGVFGASIVVIFVVNLATNLSAGIADEWSAWWSVWAFLGWGLGITVHGLVVRLNRPASSSPTWEPHQIDELLSK